MLEWMLTFAGALWPGFAALGVGAVEVAGGCVAVDIARWGAGQFLRYRTRTRPD